MKHLNNYKMYLLLAFIIAGSACLQSCSRQLTYEGGDFVIDPDGDGFTSIYDNCPNLYNPNQQDFNDNGIGDDCEVIDQNLGLVNANAELLSVEEMINTCGRLLTWQDHSNNEVKFEIIRMYEELDYDPYDGYPELREFEDVLQYGEILDASTSEIRYFEDTQMQSWMEHLKYQIKTYYDDGSSQLSNIVNTVDGC